MIKVNEKETVIVVIVIVLVVICIVLASFLLTSNRFLNCSGASVCNSDQVNIWEVAIWVRIQSMEHNSLVYQISFSEETVMMGKLQ